MEGKTNMKIPGCLKGAEKPAGFSRKEDLVGSVMDCDMLFLFFSVSLSLSFFFFFSHLSFSSCPPEWDQSAVPDVGYKVCILTYPVG